MKTLFIADLHLDKDHPQTLSAFNLYLTEKSKESIDALYILGDLFEYWLGDDAADMVSKHVAEQLSHFVSQTDASVYFIHGNRDFLLGEHYAKTAQMSLLPEVSVIDLYGEKTLILHGDTLCTDDKAYQNFRKKIRNLKWQHKVLKTPLFLRRFKAWSMRRKSKKANSKKSQKIMDVNQSAVLELMQKYDVSQMIHGHTHRPKRHEFEKSGRKMSRIVLGDWHNHISALEITPTSTNLIDVPFDIIND